jgi:ATP/maltotriose-dependent transcriptional regulator MalT
MLDERDLGGLFALIVSHCDISQHALGTMTGMPQPQVWHYIHDQHKPTLDTIAKVADRLAIPSQGRQRLGLSRDSAAAAAPKVRLSQILALAEQIGRTNDTSGLAAWRETARSGRHEDTWANLLEVITVEPPAEPRAIKRMSVRTRGFFLIAAKLPARLVIEALTAHVNEIGLLLDAVTDPVQRRELTSVSGEASYLAGCCDVDLGDLDGALARLEMVDAAAREADDLAMKAIALDGHSHFQAFQGGHELALATVTQGLQECALSGSRGTIAHMWMRVAEEHLALGHTDEAARAWDRAEASYADTDFWADRNWIRLWLTPDCFAAVRALVYSATGRPDEAVIVAEEVAGALAGALGKSDAVALVNAGLALAASGHVTRAADTGRQAMLAVRTAETSGCMPRARVLEQMLREHPKPTSSSRAFFEELEATQHHLDGLTLRRRPDTTV